MLSGMILGRRYQTATIAREAGLSVGKAVNLLKFARQCGTVTRTYETKNGFVYYTRVK